MKPFLMVAFCGSAVLLTSANGSAQSEPWWNGAPDAPAQKAPAQQTPPPSPGESQPPALPSPPVEAQPPPPQAEPPQQPPSAPSTPAEAQSQPPPPPQAEPPQYPPAPQVTEQMAGQGEWVYTARDGWLWVPYGSSTTTVGVAPYVYLFAPSYGWRWFVSPWGLGPFHYGAWGWGPRWGNGYAPPRGLGGFHYAPRVGGHGGYVPRAYGGSAGVHAAPPGHVGGASRGFGGGHVGGGHFGGGGHHR